MGSDKDKVNRAGRNSQGTRREPEINCVNQGEQSFKKVEHNGHQFCIFKILILEINYLLKLTAWGKKKNHCLEFKDCLPKNVSPRFKNILRLGFYF